MTTQEIDARKIRSIKFPPALKKGKVFVVKSKDTIIFKKMQPLSMSQVHQRLKKFVGQINDQEIIEEVQKYRKGK